MCARTQNSLKRATVKPETVSESETSTADGDRDHERPRPSSHSRTETSREETEPETVTQSELFTVSTLPETETRAATDRSRYCSVATTYTAIAEYCQSSAWTVRAEFYGFSEPIHRRKSVLIRVRVRDPTQGQEHLIAQPYTGQRATIYVYHRLDIQRPDKNRLHRGKSDLISGNCRR